MKRIYTIIAALTLGLCSVAAQTMTLKIEGKEVKNGDNVVINKAPGGTTLPFGTIYELGVEVELTSLIAQSIEVTGIDLDQMTPGLACCPTGFVCTTAGADNKWTSNCTMGNLEAGRVVKGEWIHYSYGLNNKPADGAVRKCSITLKGASETIKFNLSIDTNLSNAINTVTSNTLGNAATYNLAGQRVAAGAKGLVVRNGKKFMVK